MTLELTKEDEDIIRAAIADGGCDESYLLHVASMVIDRYKEQS